jgi:hypothetical protein
VLVAIVRQLLTFVAGGAIAIAIAIACLAASQGARIDQIGMPILFLVVWTLSSAFILGGIVGYVWPRLSHWLPGATLAVAYGGVIVPNWYHFVNRARATIPGAVAWSPAPLPWTILALLFVLAVVVVTISAFASAGLWRRRSGDHHVGQAA